MGARYPRIHELEVEVWWTADGVSHGRNPCSDLSSEPTAEATPTGWLCTLCVSTYGGGAWSAGAAAALEKALPPPGGAKGVAIQTWFIENKRGRVADIAAATGATKGRVYEVMHWFDATDEGGGVWALDPFPYDL